MVLSCTRSVIIANKDCRVGERSYIVNAEILNICSCKSKTTGAEPNMTGKMEKKKMLSSSGTGQFKCLKSLVQYLMFYVGSVR